MTYTFAISLTGQLISFALVLFSVEMLNLSKSKLVQTVWSSENIYQELQSGLPLPSGVVRWLSSTASLRRLSVAELIIAVASLLFPSGANFVLLLFVHLLICIRFRGTFNGGSDQMILVVLAGTSLGYLLKDANWGKFGLIYIAVQVAYAYLRAGFTKLSRQSWRSGRALPEFLSGSPYVDTRALGHWLASRANFSIILSLAVILFEITVWTSGFSALAANFFFCAALAFHFLIYRTFGLNRFFWAWLSAWPSLLYLASFRP